MRPRPSPPSDQVNRKKVVLVVVGSILISGVTLFWLLAQETIPLLDDTLILDSAEMAGP